jgi:hypothetical protein
MRELSGRLAPAQVNIGALSPVRRIYGDNDVANDSLFTPTA